MDFGFNQEQEMLRATARKFFENECPSTFVRKMMDGPAVMPGPYFSTVLLGGLAIQEAGSESQKKEWLTKISGGAAKVTLALTEPNARWDAAGVTLQAREARGGVTLSGTQLFVHDAHTAHAPVVAGRPGHAP